MLLLSVWVSKQFNFYIERTFPSMYLDNNTSLVLDSPFFDDKEGRVSPALVAAPSLVGEVKLFLFIAFYQVLLQLFFLFEIQN